MIIGGRNMFIGAGPHGNGGYREPETRRLLRQTSPLGCFDHAIDITNKSMVRFEARECVLLKSMLLSVSY